MGPISYQQRLYHTLPVDGKDTEIPIDVIRVHRCEKEKKVRYDPFLGCHLTSFRFGTAVARLRTRYLTRVKKEANNLLKTSAPVRKLTKRQSSLNVWVKATNLDSVIEYLSS